MLEAVGQGLSALELMARGAWSYCKPMTFKNTSNLPNAIVTMLSLGNKHTQFYIIVTDLFVFNGSLKCMGLFRYGTYFKIV